MLCSVSTKDRTCGVYTAEQGLQAAHYPCAFEKVTYLLGLSSLVYTNTRTILTFPCPDLLRAKGNKEVKESMPQGEGLEGEAGESFALIHLRS